MKLRLLAVTLAVVTAAVAVWIYQKYRPRPLLFPEIASVPVSVVENGTLMVRTPGAQLVGELARYEDELFAYLMFDYLRFRPSFAQTEVLLTSVSENGSLVYRICAILPNDWITGAPRLYQLASEFPFLFPAPVTLDDRVLRMERAQTETFVRAYNFPDYKKLEQLSRSDVVAYTRRFIRFKSNTDPRVRRRIEPVPHPLTQEEAEKLAEDIVSVTQFYDLPLDFFLGIGAMENNYMNVKGDIGNAIWKNRPAKGDIVLRRRGSRVLVLNESEGPWQIGRETLRYVHSLYLKDKRDYLLLPEHLRPPRELDVQGVETPVLTTYAGLLFRDLLDHFHGDVGMAVGAYNGGRGKPNPKYEAGVERIAQYARRVLEQASALRSQQVTDKLKR